MLFLLHPSSFGSLYLRVNPSASHCLPAPHWSYPLSVNVWTAPHTCAACPCCYASVKDMACLTFGCASWSRSCTKARSMSLSARSKLPTIYHGSSVHAGVPTVSTATLISGNDPFYHECSLVGDARDRAKDFIVDWVLENWQKMRPTNLVVVCAEQLAVSRLR